ncbi:hypothetical protein EDD85DRAFT_847299 [Armillaria nabsnona]|nr:hypothetical protein EDD85DRAFT_847299 [Armillaria nabsnona]
MAPVQWVALGVLPFLHIKLAWAAASFFSEGSLYGALDCELPGKAVFACIASCNIHIPTMLVPLHMLRNLSSIVTFY